MQTASNKDQVRQAQAQASFDNRTARSAVRHVILAVHGIGQRMGGRTIIEDAQDVRDRVNMMLDTHMASEVGLGFVQVLPVQWRKNLDLEVSYCYSDYFNN
jgi:adenylate kinase